MTPYPSVTSIAIFIWMPLSLILYFCSPIFKNFEVKDTILVDSRGERKIDPWVYEKPVVSSYLGLKFDQIESMKVLPLIELSIVDGKKLRKYGLVFYNQGSSKLLRIYKERNNVNISGMLRTFVAENPLREFFQPNIHQFVKSIELNNKNFKPTLDKSKVVNISVEFRALLADIFGLNFVTFPNFVINQGIILKSHMNLRENFESVFPYRIDTITFTNFANIPGLLMSHNIGKDKLYTYIPQNTLNPDMLVFSEDISNIKFAKMYNSLKFPKVDETFNRADPAAAYIESQALKIPMLEKTKIENSLAERFKFVARDILEKGLSSKEFLGIANRNISSLEIDNEKGSNLHRALNNIVGALTKKDYGFFGLTPPANSQGEE